MMMVHMLTKPRQMHPIVFTRPLVRAPKPAYNTVSTIIRILCTKGFVDHEDFGRSHRYFPLINKDDYKSKYLKNVVNRFFYNSYKNLVSFFSESDDLSLTELEELKKIIEKQMEKKK